MISESLELDDQDRTDPDMLWGQGNDLPPFEVLFILALIFFLYRRR